MSFLSKFSTRIALNVRQVRPVSQFRFFSTSNDKKVDDLNSKTSAEKVTETSEPKIESQTESSEPKQAPRKFFKEDGTEMTKEEIEKMANEQAEKHAAAERLWQIGAADRYWGITSPGFGILAMFTVGIILVNEYTDPTEKPDLTAEEREKRDAAEAAKKLREERLATLAAANLQSGPDADAKWQAALAAASAPPRVVVKN